MSEVPQSPPPRAFDLSKLSSSLKKHLDKLIQAGRSPLTSPAAGQAGTPQPRNVPFIAEEPNEYEADAMPDEIAIESEVLSMTKRFPGNPRLLEFGDDFLSCLKPRAAGKENTGTVIAAPKKKKK